MYMGLGFCFCCCFCLFQSDSLCFLFEVFLKTIFFMSVYGKNHYNIVISLQLIKINEKKNDSKKKIKTIFYNIILPC